MDLKQLEIDPKGQVTEFTPEHPTKGGPIEDEDGMLTLILKGPDHEDVQEVDQKYQSKLLSNGIQNRNKNQAYTAKDLQNQLMEVAIAATEDWENMIFEGQHLECNDENKKFIYTRMPWLREQVTTFIRDRANFMGE